MGFGEHIRKTVGRSKLSNPLRELQALNANLRSLGVRLPEPDARNVRKSVGQAQPRRKSMREKDQLDVATLRRIIAGETGPGVADLTRLTPPE